MWFEFSQNNSGGIFDVNDKVCHRLFIEADTASEANEKAESLGVYFNGVANMFDCSCCGDRWYETSEPISLPICWSNGLVFKTIEDYAEFLNEQYRSTTPDVRLFYKNGDVKQF